MDAVQKLELNFAGDNIIYKRKMEKSSLWRYIVVCERWRSGPKV